MRFFVSSKRGLSLVEVLVVVGIVAILTTVILGAVQEGRKKARDAQRVTDIGQIRVSLRLYRDANSVSNPTSAGEALTSTSSIGALIASNHPTFPMDPAGTSYYYDSSYTCNGVSRAVLIALAMERTNAGNYVSKCGNNFTAIITGVIPTAKSYVEILQ